MNSRKRRCSLSEKTRAVWRFPTSHSEERCVFECAAGDARDQATATEPIGVSRGDGIARRDSRSVDHHTAQLRFHFGLPPLTPLRLLANSLSTSALCLSFRKSSRPDVTSVKIGTPATQSGLIFSFALRHSHRFRILIPLNRRHRCLDVSRFHFTSVGTLVAVF
jgi:hypothetical protein